VAFANIGELSVDLLVHNLMAALVARLDSDNILACVGNNAYDVQPPGLLATALELYHVPGEHQCHAEVGSALLLFWLIGCSTSLIKAAG
jgi:hypothetical protein